MEASISGAKCQDLPQCKPVDSVHPIAAPGSISFFFFFFLFLFWLDSFCHTLCIHVNNHAGCRGINKNLSLEYNCSLGRRPKQKAVQCTRAQPDLLGQVQAGLCSVRYSLSIASFKMALSRGAYWKLSVKGIHL